MCLSVGLCACLIVLCVYVCVRVCLCVCVCVCVRSCFFSLCAHKHAFILDMFLLFFMIIPYVVRSYLSTIIFVHYTITCANRNHNNSLFITIYTFHQNDLLLFLKKGLCNDFAIVIVKCNIYISITQVHYVFHAIVCMYIT